MKVGTLIEAMETIAPLAAAESWDNVGLLVGSPSWSASRVLLTIDLTETVLDEAIEVGARAIVAYHPPIFEPLRALTDATGKQRIALRAAAAKIAVYSPHTALDAAPGGVNDWLAGAIGDGATEALAPHEAVPGSESRKLVTFCPADAVARVRDALAGAGAGHIGAYSKCSFELAGTGTFLAGRGTAPAVGKRGSLQRVDEIRLEMVCGDATLAAAVEALRTAHPYEEPPIEVYTLAPRPERGTGAGRRIVLARSCGLPAIVDSIKRRLRVPAVRVATGRDAPSRYRTAAVCAGAGGSLLDAAIAGGCELFLTGEMRHHDVLDAQARGCTIVLPGHTNTERGYLGTLRGRLARHLPKCTVTVSKRDRCPWKER
jgi:dinuclear metal center YbgI/SA1388 family protein